MSTKINDGGPALAAREQMSTDKMAQDVAQGGYMRHNLTPSTFNSANREVLRITHDGYIICNDLSVNSATHEAAKLLIASFEEQIQKMLNARAEADTARLDWLQSSINLPIKSIALRGDIRDAIDAAIKKYSK
jgi:hypothetical protein